MPTPLGIKISSFAMLLVCSMVFTYVNKYVLWILKFQYPTIFQSWQMLFAFMFQLTAAVLGFIKFPSMQLDGFKYWIPCTALFALQIYAGSVALTNLVIPHYCAMQYIVGVVQIVLNITSHFQSILSKFNVGLMLTMTGLVIAALVDPEFRYSGYKWMIIHTCSSASYSALARRKATSHIGEIDRIFYNSFFSIIYLLIIGFFTGELEETLNFPYLFYGRFHGACFISGTLCGVLILTMSHLKGVVPEATMKLNSAIILTLISVLSPIVFDMTLTIPYAFGISIALAGGLLYYFEEYKKELELVEPSKTTEC